MIFCKNCMHCRDMAMLPRSIHGFSYTTDGCYAEARTNISNVSGKSYTVCDPIDCLKARGADGICGPAGKLFVQRTGET